MADNRKFWLVEHPTHQYVEDVKSLARRHNVKVVDKQFADRFDKKFLTDEKIKLTKKPVPEKPSAKKD